MAHLVEEGFERDRLLRTRAGHQHADAARVGARRLRRQQGRVALQACDQGQRPTASLVHRNPAWNGCH